MHCMQPHRQLGVFSSQRTGRAFLRADGVGYKMTHVRLRRLRRFSCVSYIIAARLCLFSRDRDGTRHVVLIVRHRPATVLFDAVLFGQWFVNILEHSAKIELLP
jgi:hypothetical protein